MSFKQSKFSENLITYLSKFYNKIFFESNKQKSINKLEIK